MATKNLCFTVSIVLVAAFFLVTMNLPVRADDITANKFTFKSNDPTVTTANDFHLKLSRGQFIGEPTSDRFPNHTNADGKTNTDFSGNTINNNDSTNVKFKSNQVSDARRIFHI